MAIERHRRPREHAIDDLIGGFGRDQAGVCDDRHDRDRVVPAGAWARGRTEPTVEADLDQLDPPVQDISEGAHGPPGRAARVVGAATDLVEQLAQR